MILLTGASGVAGGAVLEGALARHLPVRAMYRNSEEQHRAAPGHSTVIADYGDPDSLDRALADIDIVYIVCGPIPQLVEFETNMTKLAVGQACVTLS